MALAFIPAVIAYSLSKRYKKHSLIIYSIVLICFAIVFFLTHFLPQSFQLPVKMAERQQAFLQLSGNSYLRTDTLNGNISSYINVFPQALNHVFIRPYFSEAKGPLYIFSFLENLFFFFLLIRIIANPSTCFKQLINDPLILFISMIAILNYIIIGYTVPFLGAIVRYKASFEILFILVFLQLQNMPINYASFNKKYCNTLN